MASLVLRPASRALRRASIASPTTRRAMSSDAHKPKSDLPWMIGSAAVFGSGIIYMLLPQSKSTVHAAAESHPPEPKHGAGDKGKPLPDDDGTEASAHDVKESISKSVKTDSPKEAKAAEEGKNAEVDDSDKPSEGNGKKGLKSGGYVEKPTDLGDARKTARSEGSPKEKKNQEEQTRTAKDKSANE